MMVTLFFDILIVSLLLAILDLATYARLKCNGISC